MIVINAPMKQNKAADVYVATRKGRAWLYSVTYKGRRLGHTVTPEAKTAA